MKKKLALLAVATLLLTSCGATSTASVNPVETNTKLKDGRTITCISIVGLQSSVAITCDWEKAK